MRDFGNWLVVVKLLLCGFCSSVFGADFTVTTPNNQFSYKINGVGGNPTITLMRGKTYTFSLATAGDHPFAFGTDIGFPAPPGVSGANGLSTGTITFKVPSNAKDCVYYCVVHEFNGKVHMINPPVQPPTVTIVGLTLGTNLALKTAQASTNGFTVIPEANTEPGTTNWFALTVQSSRFDNGTNEIFCGKPVGTNALFRIRIQ